MLQDFNWYKLKLSCISLNQMVQRDNVVQRIGYLLIWKLRKIFWLPGASVGSFRNLNIVLYITLSLFVCFALFHFVFLDVW